ncbi:hypothetical protein ACIG0C_02710 [Kitasatospora aureofaciens]|uniref:Uncharacterized protein n=1 Tax=Kitasatospora aureofaciens TaxID=1894 RepID=A0A1E7N125_KITAU|nr:hypothetical protein [Kitasatospora aureofaciens]ARF79219.1 hypothetical protein B6264_10095 [Kitasatospora aureofaciens]OEV34400.1 hypothetical protein HS99_0035915 [Kitasatospora aureofaciens]GGU67993.1 hypothetical protein GCM10010502_19170 [Kitasatospora aureofaciens]
MAVTRRRVGTSALRAAQWTAAGVLGGTGLLGLLLFALGRARTWQALGGGLVVAGASTVLGGALGFLFGVPRVKSGSGEPQGSYAPNTNLEQVSDWLTKVLLGVGLTQLGSLGERLHKLGASLAPVLGGGDAAAPFAAALVLHFLVLGFLAGWLVTRLALPRVLTETDEALDLFLAGQDRDRRGDKVGADDLRVRAMQQLGLLGGSAGRSAAQLPPASGSPAGPEGVVAEVRSTAKRSALTADQVRALFADGTDGRRIQALALMQGDPSLADLTSLLDAIEHPCSGFEQYHALLAARGLLSRLSGAEAQRLRDAVAAQLVDPQGIPYGSDRSWLAEKILSRLPVTASVPAQPTASVPAQPTVAVPVQQAVAAGSDGPASSAQAPGEPNS